MTFRPSEKILERINAVMKQKKINRTQAINYLLESASELQLEQGENSSPQPKHEKPFDYESWYCDCEYGTYFKEKKKVHCACTYPSIQKMLPKDRLVDPQVCDTCSPRVERIKEWIVEKQKEKQALQHTGKYFTNEFGKRIRY